MLLILSTKPQKLHAKKTLALISKKLKSKHVENSIGYFEDISITMEKNTLDIFIKEQNIRSYSAIYFRKVGTFKNFAHLMCQYASNNNMRFLDRFRLTTVSRTKMNQCATFAMKNIPFPKTFAAGEWNDSSINKALLTLNMPIIIKSLSSSQGKGVDMARTTTELRAKIKKLTLKKIQFILQDFVNNDFEYRILVLGGKAAIAETKTRQANEFRNNVSLGATEKFISLSTVPKNVLRNAEKASKAMGVDIAGVDVVVDAKTKIAYVLEVNTAPQFTLNEEISNELNSITHYLSLWTKAKNS